MPDVDPRLRRARSGPAGSASRPPAPTSRRSSAPSSRAEGEEATAAWLEGLAENGTVLDNNLVVMQSVNEGDVEAGIAYHYYWYRDQKESGENSDSTALHFFGDQDPGAFVSISGAGVLASSEHQDDAQRFVEFLTSTEGQQAMADSYALEYPLNPEADPRPRGEAVRRARAAGDRPRHAQRPEGHRADDRGRPALTLLAAPEPPTRSRRRDGVPSGALAAARRSAAAVALLALVPLGFVATYAVLDRPGRGLGADRPAAGRACCSGTRSGSRSAAWCSAPSSASALAFLVERTDVRVQGALARPAGRAARRPGLRQQLCLGLPGPLGRGVRRRAAGHHAVLLPAGLPAGRRRPARPRPGAGGVGLVAGPQPLAVVPRRSCCRSSGRRCSAACCWSGCTCSPSSARSSCCASRPSPPRSTTSTAPPSTARPPT